MGERKKFSSKNFREKKKDKIKKQMEMQRKIHIRPIKEIQS